MDERICVKGNTGDEMHLEEKRHQVCDLQERKLRRRWAVLGRRIDRRHRRYANVVVVTIVVAVVVVVIRVVVVLLVTVCTGITAIAAIKIGAATLLLLLLPPLLPLLTAGLLLPSNDTPHGVGVKGEEPVLRYTHETPWAQWEKRSPILGG
jgi:hypothetical protein